MAVDQASGLVIDGENKEILIIVIAFFVQQRGLRILKEQSCWSIANKVYTIVSYIEIWRVSPGSRLSFGHLTLWQSLRMT